MLGGESDHLATVVGPLILLTSSDRQLNFDTRLLIVVLRAYIKINSSIKI